MSRSGYSEDCSDWDLIQWRGAVMSGLRGQRGQEFLIGMAKLMDEMPVKRLIENNLIKDGECCTLGLACQALKTDLSDIAIDDGYMEHADVDVLAARLNISPAMAKEIMFENDDDFSYGSKETPEHRWTRMRKWVDEQIVK